MAKANQIASGDDSTPIAACQVSAATLLDLAELLNVRAYARTFVSRRPAASAELEEAVTAAEGASVLHASRRARWALGRTLTSAAHALALDAITDEAARTRLLQRWDGAETMFKAAMAELHAAFESLKEGPQAPTADAMQEALTRDILAAPAAVDRGIVEAALHAAATTAHAAAAPEESPMEKALQHGVILASLGECWYCIASAAVSTRQELLGVRAESAAFKARALLEAALCHLGRHGLKSSLEFADAAKDYGKVMECFFGVGHGRAALTMSLSLHRELLGDDHPRSRNVARLLDREQRD